MPIPTPVRQLDSLLNHRILRAANTLDAGHWWAVKVRAKRLLQLAHPRDVDMLAGRMLAILRRQRPRAAAIAA
jgi:hypothetical protein